MPKIVDHHQQKEKIAEAVWRIIRREGMERATVRQIAEEAGVSVGSLRYYFSTQSELLAFSMQLVSVRVHKRIESISFKGPLMEDIQQLFFELLPMDAERKAEMEVWLAFTAKALADPTLQALKDEVYTSLRNAMVSIIEALIKDELMDKPEDRDIEVERLYALLDGLALHGVMQPSQITPDRIRAIVQHHLKTLCQ
ncbi:HTH-type transcriptional regulator BetI [compost metagenome]